MTNIESGLRPRSATETLAAAISHTYIELDSRVCSALSAEAGCAFAAVTQRADEALAEASKNAIEIYRQALLDRRDHPDDLHFTLRVVIAREHAREAINRR